MDKLYKSIVIALVIILIGLFECYAQQVYTTKSKRLPIYEPTIEAMAILDTVLMTKHPKLKYQNDEIFTINGNNQVLIINLHDTLSSKLIGQFGWDAFKGCVLYKKRLFLLDENNSHDKLFTKTRNVKKFNSYTSNAFPIIDESLYAFWKFQLFDDKYVLTDIHPYQIIELIKED